MLQHNRFYVVKRSQVKFTCEMLFINTKLKDIDTDASVSHLTRCLSTYVLLCKLIRFRFETYSFQTFELFQETGRKSKIAFFFERRH